MYRKKKTLKKFKLVIITIVSIALIIGSIFFLQNERTLSFIEKMTRDGILFISDIVLTPVNFVKEKIEEKNEKNALYKKYKGIEASTVNYENLVAEKEELEKELNELKKVTEIESLLSEKKVMHAVVIGRNLDYWHDTITIDKGSHDGVEEGMPVVVSEGLIGKIVSVSNFNSTVKLLTSSNMNKISVKVKSGEDYIYGLLTSYDAKENLYKIEGISQTDEITANSLVTTTGLGNIFPSGIVIGKVVGSQSDNYDLARIVQVTPSVNFNAFTVVTILKRNVDQ